MNGWSGYRNFATLDGAGIVEILRLTGFKTYTEFMTETSIYERAFLAEAVGEWHEQHSPSGGGL